MKTKIRIIYKINKLEQASMSVEAAFIMPFVILIIIAMCYLTFYMHDYCKLQCLLDRAAVRKGIEIHYDQSNNSKIELTTDTIIHDLKGRLTILKLENVTIKETNSSILLDAVVEPHVSIGSIKNTFFSEKLRVKSKVRIQDPADFLRAYSVLKDLANNIKDKVQ